MNTAKATLNDRIDRKTELEERRKTAAQERGRAQGELLGLRAKRLLEARNAVESWERSVQRTKEGHPSRRDYQARLDEARTSYQRLQSREEQLDARHKELCAEIQAIDAELLNYEVGAGIEDAIAHQKAVRDAGQAVERLRALIAQRQDELNEVDDTGEDRLRELQKQREAILADISLGHKKPSALQAIDKEIQSVVEDHGPKQQQALAKFRDLTQTIAGLRQRLGEAEREQANLQSRTGEVRAQLILGQAHAAYAKYLRCAEQLVVLFRRMVAFQSLYRQHASNPAKLSESVPWNEMLIPLFDLDGACGIEPHDPRRGVLFQSTRAMDRNNSLGRSEFDAQQEAELARLREAGLDGLF